MNKINCFGNNNEKYIYIYIITILWIIATYNPISNDKNRFPTGEHRISLKNASYRNRFGHVTYTFSDEKS